MGYRDSKDLARITASDKVLSDKALTIAKKTTQYDGYQRELASIVYKCLDKKSGLLADKFFLLVLLKVNLCQTSNWLNNYTNRLLENLKNESTLTFCRQCLGCWPSQYAINKVSFMMDFFV